MTNRPLPIYYDLRWEGNHGIGRFSKELRPRLEAQADLQLSNHYFSSCCAFTPGFKPLLQFSKFIFTLHDLNHLDLPENSSPLKRLYYQTFIRLGISRAYRVITGSNYSKQRILDWSGCQPEKIQVISHGVSSAFNPQAKPALPGYRYLFCCSNRKPHKNEQRLIEAYRLSGLAPQLKLVLTGTATKELQRQLRQTGLEQQVYFTGVLTDQELAEWYRGATCTVFPSLYEGFGLPVLESMACGTPVIASSATALPEVAGTAALYIDHASTASIAQGLQTLTSQPQLQQQLKQQGLNQAKRYCWNKTATQIADLLQQMQTTA